MKREDLIQEAVDFAVVGDVTRATLPLLFLIEQSLTRIVAALERRNELGGMGAVGDLATKVGPPD